MRSALKQVGEIDSWCSRFSKRPTQQASCIQRAVLAMHRVGEMAVELTQSATALALHNQLLRESYELISLVTRAPCHLMVIQAAPWHKVLQMGAMDQVRYKLACSCRRLRERVQEDRSRGAQLVTGWS